MQIWNFLVQSTAHVLAHLANFPDRMNHFFYFAKYNLLNIDFRSGRIELFSARKLFFGGKLQVSLKKRCVSLNMQNENFKWCVYEIYFRFILQENELLQSYVTPLVRRFGIFAVFKAIRIKLVIPFTRDKNWCVACYDLAKEKFCIIKKFCYFCVFFFFILEWRKILQT